MPIPFPAPLKPYATHAAQSRGRLCQEPESQSRTPYARDRDRVIHSVAFRRLMHKTQVFISNESDHFRTRLTHSMEVAQIARSMARTLQIDEDLAETVALAHDLGHAAFGHTGEDVLQDCMIAFGGFDHNAQTLRILTKLEQRHAGFDGLNLTWETLEGVVKHNGPLIGPIAERIAIEKGKELEPLPTVLQEYAQDQDLWLDSFASLEAQVGALADDIAYNNHDVDDGLRAGVFTLDDAKDVPILGDAVNNMRLRFPDANEELIIAEAVSDMIGIMVNDVIGETNRRLAILNPQSADDIRRADRAMVDFSDDMQPKIAALRKFLWTKMYRHYKVNRVRSQAKRVVEDLFTLFMNEPETLPPEWQEKWQEKIDAGEGGDPDKLARVVCDYIAGMTDRYAIIEHKKLFDLASWS